MSSCVAPASTVVVSGGSRGLGLAIVEDLVAQGVQVATFARSVSPELTALADRHPDILFCTAIDAVDQSAVQGFLHQAAERFGPVDGLVNNAARGQDSLLMHTGADEIEQIIHTNLVTPILLTRQFLRRAHRLSISTRIVVITSIGAQRAHSGLTVYSAAKAGLEASARCIAREMRGRTQINCVAPGFFESAMSAPLSVRDVGRVASRSPSGRLLNISDILPVVRMLLLHEVGINGQVLTVDSGGSI